MVRAERDLAAIQTIFELGCEPKETTQHKLKIASKVNFEG